MIRRCVSIFLGLSLSMVSAEASAGGLFELLFGPSGPAERFETMRPPPPPPMQPGWPGDRPALRRAAKAKASSRAAGPAETSNDLVCVRSCDGYAFPVPSGNRSQNTAQTLCQAACPGAQTVATRASGAALAKSSTAVTLASFRKPDFGAGACGCNPAGELASWVDRILTDPTLRRGDVVVTTPNSARVFVGKESGRTMSRSDFADIRVKGIVVAGIFQSVDRVMGFSFRDGHAKATQVAVAAGRRNEILVTPRTTGSIPQQAPAVTVVSKLASAGFASAERAAPAALPMPRVVLAAPFGR